MVIWEELGDDVRLMIILGFFWFVEVNVFSGFDCCEELFLMLFSGLCEWFVCFGECLWGLCFVIDKLGLYFLEFDFCVFVFNGCLFMFFFFLGFDNGFWGVEDVGGVSGGVGWVNLSGMVEMLMEVVV